MGAGPPVARATPAPATWLVAGPRNCSTAAMTWRKPVMVGGEGGVGGGGGGGGGDGGVGRPEPGPPPKIARPGRGPGGGEDGLGHAPPRDRPPPVPRPAMGAGPHVGGRVAQVAGALG